MNGEKGLVHTYDLCRVPTTDTNSGLSISVLLSCKFLHPFRFAKISVKSTDHSAYFKPYWSQYAFIPSRFSDCPPFSSHSIKSLIDNTLPSPKVMQVWVLYKGGRR